MRRESDPSLPQGMDEGWDGSSILPIFHPSYQTGPQRYWKTLKIRNKFNLVFMIVALMQYYPHKSNFIQFVFMIEGSKRYRRRLESTIS